MEWQVQEQLPSAIQRLIVQDKEEIFEGMWSLDSALLTGQTAEKPSSNNEAWP